MIKLYNNLLIFIRVETNLKNVKRDSENILILQIIFLDDDLHKHNTKSKPNPDPNIH